MELLPLVDRWAEGSRLSTPYALDVDVERFLDMDPGCWCTLYSRMHTGSLSVCPFPLLYRVHSPRIEHSCRTQTLRYYGLYRHGSHIFPSQSVLLIREHICISIGSGNERIYYRCNHLRERGA